MTPTTDVPFFLLRGWQISGLPFSSGFKASCRDDKICHCPEGFGWLVWEPQKLSSKQGRPTGEPSQPEELGSQPRDDSSSTGLLSPKNVEVPKCSSTWYPTPKLKSSTFDSDSLHLPSPNGPSLHLLSAAQAALPRSFHMKTTSLLGGESMNMRESWEGTPLATKVPSWMPKSEWTSDFFRQNLGWFSWLHHPPTSYVLQI